MPKDLLRLLAFSVALLLFVSCNQPDPNDPAVQAAMNEAVNLGLAFLEENRLAEAQTEFEKVIDLAPNDALGYANVGIVHLRRADLDAAEAALTRAKRLAPEDPSIRMSLAEVYRQGQNREAARSEMNEALDANADHVPSLYLRAQLYDDEPNAYVRYLHEVIQRASANVVPRLHYVEALLDVDEPDSALFQLEAIRSQLPALPEQALGPFNDTRTHLQTGAVNQAQITARFFHNSLKTTSFYQTGLRLLGIRSDALAGTPLITEPRASFLQSAETFNILDELRFSDATNTAQLDTFFPDEPTLATVLAVADYNGDTEYDLFVATWDSSNNQSTIRLLENRFGRFSDVTETSALSASNRIRAAQFADFDNDTFLDLFLLSEGPNHLFRNNGDGTFSDVSSRSGLAIETQGHTTLAADLDHDGDLDLFIGRTGSNLLFRNNGDGTFTEQAAEMGLAGPSEATTQDAAFGDFDDDGDLDLFVAHANATSTLYSNLRQGRFEEVDASALARSASSVAVNDYNNDGAMDLLLVSSDGPLLVQNTGNAQFEVDTAPTDLLQSSSSQIVDATFMDFDNDGFLDILLAGSGLHLFHNDGPSLFSDRSELLDTPNAGTTQIRVADYNQDRDLDVFISTGGGLILLRNDGGDLNKALTIQPRGLITGSSKNNYFGIGSKVEVRAGDLYQSRVVTDPVVHIGLGQRLKADVIRIVFTNGVPQNIFRPGSDQDIIEEQILKGSCPFLYTWDGERFVFATDILWRSALGMPLGILGSEATYAPALSAQDYVKVPGHLLQPIDGEYRIQLTDELWETPYFDEVKLIAVDHPDSVAIFLDEGFGPPPPSPLPIYQVTQRIELKQAYDGSGNSVLHQLQAHDSLFVATMQPSAYQGQMEKHELILDPGNLGDTKHIALYLHGWIFPTDASINIAMSQSSLATPAAPEVQVINAAGTWETVIPNMGFPMGKNKTIRLDLSGYFATDDYRVRIRTSMQLYWDYAFFTRAEPQTSVHLTTLAPQKADLQFRGFSRVYRTSPYGPHLFDHAIVSTEPRWLDLAGNYTRYGDVTPLLQTTDDQYVIMNAGDVISMSFDASQTPPLPENWMRTFILHSDGWLKDGDLQTAHGQTVTPLPFQGMSSYPYPPTENYPMTPENRAYMEQYNTRSVSQARFRSHLRTSFSSDTP